MILPQNFEKTYPCINECGASSIIYANPDFTEAYKIYKNTFPYEENKFKKYTNYNHPNFFFPKDTLSKENNQDQLIGYKMDFDQGTALSKLINVDINKLIKEAQNIHNSLKDLSNNHFLIVDPNIDNITFSNTFKFVDTYSYLLLPKYSSEIIYTRNILKTNETVLCGLISFSYKKLILEYLKNTNSKYLELFIKYIETETKTEQYIYHILSIIQETTKENNLPEIKKRILK